MIDFHTTSFEHSSGNLNVQSHLLAKDSHTSNRDFMHFTTNVIPYPDYE